MSCTIRDNPPIGQPSERVVSIDLLVCPGQIITSANPVHRSSDPKREREVTLQKVEESRSIILRQARLVWCPFVIEEDGRRLRYSFDIEVSCTQNPLPVRRRILDTNARNYRDDPTLEHARATADAMAEAGVTGNLVVIHPVLGQSAHAPRMDSGQFVSMEESRHRGLLGLTANIAYLGYSDVLGNSYLSAAHEIGHMLGIRDRDGWDGSIMGHHPGVGVAQRRLLGIDQALLHDAVEAELGGIRWLTPHRVPRERQQRPTRRAVHRRR